MTPSALHSEALEDITIIAAGSHPSHGELRKVIGATLTPVALISGSGSGADGRLHHFAAELVDMFTAQFGLVAATVRSAYRTHERPTDARLLPDAVAVRVDWLQAAPDLLVPRTTSAIYDLLVGLSEARAAVLEVVGPVPAIDDSSPIVPLRSTSESDLASPDLAQEAERRMTSRPLGPGRVGSGPASQQLARCASARSRPGRAVLAKVDDDFVTVSGMGETIGGEQLGVICRVPGRGMRAVYRAVEDGTPTLTDDPSRPGTHDARRLGYVHPDPGPARWPLYAGMDLLGYAEAVDGGRAPHHVVVAEPPGSSPSLEASVKGRVRRSAVRCVRKPNVLMVLPWFSFGGGDQLMREIAILLTARGQSVSVALTTDPGESPPDDSPSLAEHVRGIECIAPTVSGIDIGPALGQMIRRQRIDRVLVCGGWQAYSSLPGLRTAFPELTVIDQLFNDVGHLQSNRRWSRSIDLTLCAYRGLERRIQSEWGEDPLRTKTIYVGIEAERFRFDDEERGDDIRLKFGLDPTRPVVGAVGRLSWEKRFDLLLRAVGGIPPDRRPQVLLQGSGPDEAALRDLGDRLGVRLSIRPHGPDVTSTLRALDAFVLSSEVEGIPQSVMEAMVVGVPVVATAVGGVPELVGHGRGFLVGPGSPGSIGLGLQAALECQDHLRQQIISDARAFVLEDMSRKAMLDSYGEIFRWSGVRRL